ncbi:MAG: hypothetical protein LBO62_03135 [Endomicrobium sp.]|jgi:FlaA1/EpsC-like NDP-sugar epimerase|nr:hypothetical protein [Endomicrobium sp.]
MFTLVLFVGDLFIFAASIFLAVSLRTLDFDVYYCVKNLISFAPLFPLVALSSYIFSFYDIKFLRKSGLKRAAFYLFLINVFIGFAFFYLFSFFLNIYTPKTILLLSFLLYFFLVYCLRKLCVKLRGSGIAIRKNILIIGEGNVFDEIRSEVSKSNEYNILSEKDIYSANID